MSELQSIIEATPSSTRFWIDETYIEYVGSAHSLEQFGCQRKNVVVCKSMSKGYALSGVRSAYLCASPEILEPLRALTPPWAVSLPGQVAAVKALEDPDYYQAQYQATALARESMARDLQELGLEVIPSVANFLLTFLPADGPTAAQVIQHCRRSGVHLRDASNMGSALGTHALRTAVKSPQQNSQIVTAIAEALSTV
jgi:histidinol-phosphate/aromatic aminotransferase/cobyric acid decarboxylase-like protein